MQVEKVSEGGRREAVTDQILGFIRSRQLEPGARLPPEPELCEMFGVSRAVVREAMQSLQATGTIRIEHGRGTFVSANPLAQPFSVWASMNVHRVAELFEVRMILEGEAASRAAMRRTAVHLDEITHAMDDALDCAARTDWLAFMDVDIRFHRAVTQAAGLPLLQEMLEVAIPVWMNMTSSVARERNQAVRLAAVVAEHAAVHDAIRASEPEAARYAMRRHLGNSRDRRIENDKQDG